MVHLARLRLGVHLGEEAVSLAYGAHSDFPGVVTGAQPSVDILFPQPIFYAFCTYRRVRLSSFQFPQTILRICEPSVIGLDVTK